MKTTALLFLALFCVVSSTKVTPVQKVIQLMEDMLAKGKDEKQKEAVMFASFSQFCSDTQRQTSENIAEGNEKIERLAASIEKYDTTAKTLGQEIADHNANIIRLNNEIAAGQKLRDQEHTDYLSTHKDYSESVDALERAITVLKNQSHDRKQASEALLQISPLLNAPMKSQIDSFLQQTPKANAYEFQSSKIVDLLAKLLDQFEDERTALERSESNKKHSFLMIKQDQTGQVNDHKSAVTDKTADKAENEQLSGEANVDKDETTKNRDEDEKYLKELNSTCETKHRDFKNRQELRGEEIDAIAKAIEIMSSGSVSGASDKHTTAMDFVQTAFYQLRSTSKHTQTQLEEDNMSKTLSYLESKGDKLGSEAIKVLLVQVQSDADPFRKIKKMIKQLINRLMEEANAEAKEKAICDKNLSLNEKKRNKYTSKIDENNSTIDSLTSAISKLSEEIDTLTKQKNELLAQSQEETKLRQAEKEKNNKTIKDAKEAQAAVAQAIEVLESFYKKAQRATSLISQPRNAEIPQVMTKSYKGQQGESGGVLGMLEVIQSDFARLQSETEEAEATSEREYQAQETERQTDISDKEQSVANKEQTRDEKRTDKENETTDLSENTDQLNNAEKEYDALKAQCVDPGVSFEERIKRRREEIQSLQEALKILSGDDIA